jgi:hypothetical protein
LPKRKNWWEYVFQVKPTMNPEARFPLREEKAEGLFDKLGCQLFKVTDGVWECASLLVGHGKVWKLGEYFGGSGVMSACLADLDGDGREELVYSYSFGSGIHRSHVAAWKPTADGAGREVVAALAFGGDLFVRRLADGTVSVEAGEFKGSVNNWVRGATLGTARMVKREDRASLEIELAKDLPGNVRENVWK